ncbi:hypothetical protein [Streptomyces avidinii]|uniref:Uncharacterized protein n=1 Tax=Streptomyces avidinii TaxID=1895 RepID=A0ABS4L9C7_STRAV|nr:hypothetical protein [Streptomyces avidinii]MBP2038720.1 hypothetical protein [Streptomyces avidinii]GGZ12020.1 hypothetical protein GCM10010343_43710 [Streptomyces avidinii]
MADLTGDRLHGGFGARRRVGRQRPAPVGRVGRRRPADRLAEAAGDRDFRDGVRTDLASGVWGGGVERP